MLDAKNLEVLNGVKTITKVSAAILIPSIPEGKITCSVKPSEEIDGFIRTRKYEGSVRLHAPALNKAGQLMLPQVTPKQGNVPTDEVSFETHHEGLPSFMLLFKCGDEPGYEASVRSPLEQEVSNRYMKLHIVAVPVRDLKGVECWRSLGFILAANRCSEQFVNLRSLTFIRPEDRGDADDLGYTNNWLPKIEKPKKVEIPSV